MSEATPPPPPPEPAGSPPGSGPNVDLAFLLKGNWAGAAKVAAAAFGVALVAGLVVALAGADDLDFASAIWAGLILTAAAFGADTQIDLSDEGFYDSASFNLGQYPLLATFLALGVAAYLFRRMVAGYPNAKEGLLDAARAALILSGLVTLLAIVLKIATPDIDGYAGLDETDSDVLGLVILNGESSVSLAGAIFLPFLLLATVLGLTCLARRDWLSGRLAQVHDWIAAPLAGIVVVIAALLAAGVLWVIAELIHEEDARGFAEIVRLLAVLPAAGLYLVGLGSLGTIGETSEGDGEDDEERWDRLWDFADDNGSTFYVAPLAAVAIAVLGVLAVIRRSPNRGQLLRDVGVYLASLVVVVPFLIRLANAHVSSEVEAEGRDFEFSATAGLDGFQTTLLFLLLSAVAAAVILVATGKLSVDEVKAKAQSLQTKATESSKQWGQQQPPAESATPPVPPPATGEPLAPPPPDELPPEEPLEEPPGWDQPPPPRQ